MDETIKKKYLKCKFKVKKWESEFKKAFGSNPSKTDIKNAPSNIKEAYKIYWKLKTISLETSLVDVSFGEEDTMDAFSFCASQDTENSSQVSMQAQDDQPSQGADALEKVTEPNNSPDLPSLLDCLKTEQSDFEKKDITCAKENEELNKSSIWGPHLNKTKKVEEKPKPEKPAVSSRYTAKLFAGATFKKRNPRKAFIRREKSAGDSQSILDDSQSSVMSDFGQSLSQLEQSATCDDKTAAEERDQNSFLDEDSCGLDFNSSGSRLKIVNNPQVQKQSQPVSLLQKTLLSNKSAKPLGVRIVDKGWLERLDKATSIEEGNKGNSSDSGIELTDSSVVSVEVKSSPLQVSVLDNDTVSDDDDFVCDSDSENESSRSISTFRSLPNTKSLSQLPKFTNSDLKRASSSLSSLNPLKTEPFLSKTDKRSIDQIDKDVIDARDTKKCRFDNTVSNGISSSFEAENKIYSLSPLPCRTLNSNNQNNVETTATQSNRLVEIQNKTPKTKEMKQEEILKKKVSSGRANENFVKINIKKKTYVRGKKTMTFQKYKKQKWKEIKKNQTNGGVYKCFKCGDVGHFAKNCLKACDQLLPKEDLDEEEESPFPSLQEAEEMAMEASKKLCVRRNLNNLPVHMTRESSDASESAPPPCPPTDDIMRFLTNHEPVFNLLEDGSVVDTPLVVLEALGKFGHDSWRRGQEVAVMRVLSGLSTLVTLATGSGKSLCYQLPAYLYHTMQQRITLVVSPLVSLMEDQVHGVPSCLRVACLHTNQTPQARADVYSALRDNSLHLLLLSPEAVAGAERNTELLRALPPVAFAAIDEAHCISHWSHNFRPDYLTLCQVLREKFGVKTLLGLTATATEATIASVSTALGLPDGVAGVIRDRPLPDNLQLSVSLDTNKDQALVQLLRGGRFSQCHSIIIYCTRRDECQRLAAYIRTCLQDVSKEDGIAKRGKLSWNAEAYHAGLTAARRRAVQKAFMSGKTRIVVATVAFGMGINKQDIQGVIHYNMPSAFERYVQEVGRAGRDGHIAHCHLFLNTEGRDLQELRRHVYADSVERHTIRKLLQRVFVPCGCGEACPSHEVAFSVSETVLALDLPEENIATLLCYLQLHAKVPVQVCSRAYTQCRILFYKGPKLIRQAVKECPPLAMAVALAAERGCKLERLTKLEFPVFPVAAAIKWDSGVVKQQLKNLEWTKVNDQPRRSGVTVELHDLGFRVTAPGNLSEEQLDSVLDSLTERVERQEDTALRQLQAIFQVLNKVSHQSVEECLDEVDSARCEELKSNVRQYFAEDSFLDSHSLPQVTLTNEDQVTSDVRTLVNCYRDVTWSGRAVARVFHGIASPNFPAQTWGRCRLWRAHLHEDFKLLSRLATRELIKLR